MTIVIGIDPGLTGAVAAIDRRGSVRIADLPTKPMEYVCMGARRIDLRALVLVLRDMWPADEDAMVVVEEVGIMRGAGNAIQTVGSLCATAALVLGALDILRVAPKTVAPKVWKSSLGLKRDTTEKESRWKGRHLAMARELYPNAAGLDRAKDHNRAEALLIAHYGQKTFT